MDRNNKKQKYKCIKANISKLHMPPTNYHLPAAQQQPQKGRIFWGEKVRRMDHLQKNDKTERVRGVGRKTREEIRKGESNESPEIPDRRGHPTSLT